MHASSSYARVTLDNETFLSEEVSLFLLELHFVLDCTGMSSVSIRRGMKAKEASLLFQIFSQTVVELNPCLPTVGPRLHLHFIVTAVQASITVWLDSKTQLSPS